MSILRNPLKEKFSQIPNEMIIDLDLSAIEFRLMCYLFSRPDGWQVRNTDIMNKLGIRRRETLAGYWKKLIKMEYIIRHEKEKILGQFKGYDYELTMKCFGKPCTVQPCTEEPDTGTTRHGDNRTLSNTNSLINTDTKEIRSLDHSTPNGESQPTNQGISDSDRFINKFDLILNEDGIRYTFVELVESIMSDKLKPITLTFIDNQNISDPIKFFRLVSNLKKYNWSNKTITEFYDILQKKVDNDLQDLRCKSANYTKEEVIGQFNEFLKTG